MFCLANKLVCAQINQHVLCYIFPWHWVTEMTQIGLSLTQLFLFHFIFLKSVQMG